MSLFPVTSRWRKIVVCIFLCAGTLASVGQTATFGTGLPHPFGSEDGVALSKTMLQFNGFGERQFGDDLPAPAAAFSLKLELKNTTAMHRKAYPTIPVNLFFIQPGERTDPIYSALQGLFPDILPNLNDAKANREALRKVFDKKQFIRRSLNPQDLKLLKIGSVGMSGEQPHELDQIRLVFRLTEDLEARVSNLLEVEVQLVYEVSLGPQASASLDVQYVIPVRIDKDAVGDQMYVPIGFGKARHWASSIGAAHITFKPLDAEVMIPGYLDYAIQDYGYDRRIIGFKNYLPERTDRIALLGYRHRICPCESGTGQEDILAYPLSVHEMQRSKAADNTEVRSGLCSRVQHHVIHGRWVPEFLSGPAELASSMLAVPPDSIAGFDLGQSLRSDCPDDAGPTLRIIDANDPFWAFDYGQDSLRSYQGTQRGAFGLNSAWCMDGQPIGQWVSFRISQEAAAIRLFTGLQGDPESYEETSRVKHFELLHIQSGSKKNLLLSDLQLSSTYEHKLEPGDYKLTVKKIYPGQSQRNTTCLCSIQFDFITGDKWLDQFRDTRP